MHEDITTAAGRRANSEARQAAREAEHDPAYEIILNGDRAEADTIGGALLAAATLATDQANGIYGAARLIRRDVVITRDGLYDGSLTEQARAGERGDVEINRVTTMRADGTTPPKENR